MSREQAAGESHAYACLIRGTGKTIALYGRNAEQVRAEVADLQHGLQFVPMATVAGSDDVEVCRDADALVLTAGVPFRPGQRRLDLAAGSVAICRDLLPRLLEVAPGAVLVIVTNPVDVVTYVALKIGGLPPHRVLGSGTVLDSSRLRSLIAQRCSVAVQNVHAYIAGEHGDSEIPLWTSATVSGFRSCAGRTPDGLRSPPPREMTCAARWSGRGGRGQATRRAGRRPRRDGEQHTIHKGLLQVAQAQEVWRDSASAEARHALADATDQLLPAMNEHLALEEERVVPLIEKYDTQAEYAHVAREGSAEVPPDKLPVMADMFRYEADTAAIDLAVADMPAEAQPVIRDLAAKAYAAYEGPVRHLRSSPRDELIPGRFGPALQRLQASGEESKR